VKAFCERKLKEPFLSDPGCRYERLREDGIIASQAVLIAVGVDWEGCRQVLAVELANREDPGRAGKTLWKR
jgi:putative transposase